MTPSGRGNEFSEERFVRGVRNLENSIGNITWTFQSSKRILRDLTVGHIYLARLIIGPKIRDPCCLQSLGFKMSPLVIPTKDRAIFFRNPIIPFSNTMGLGSNRSINRGSDTPAQDGTIKRP